MLGHNENILQTNITLHIFCTLVISCMLLNYDPTVNIFCGFHYFAFSFFPWADQTAAASSYFSAINYFSNLLWPQLVWLNVWFQSLQCRNIKGGLPHNTFSSTVTRYQNKSKWEFLSSFLAIPTSVPFICSTTVAQH